MFVKLNLVNMLDVYHKNKRDIDEWMYFQSLKKKGLIVENYISNDETGKDDKKYLGLAVGVFITLLIIQLVIFVLAIYFLVKNSKVMPSWALVVAILFLLWFPLMTLLFALLIKK